MGNLLWTAITYAATIGIVMITFRMVVQDRIENNETITNRLLLRAKKAAEEPGKAPANAPPWAQKRRRF